MQCSIEKFGIFWAVHVIGLLDLSPNTNTRFVVPFMLAVSSPCCAHMQRRERLDLGGVCKKTFSLSLMLAPSSCFSLLRGSYRIVSTSTGVLPGRNIFTARGQRLRSKVLEALSVVNYRGSQSLWTAWTLHLRSGKGVYVCVCICVYVRVRSSLFFGRGGGYVVFLMFAASHERVELSRKKLLVFGGKGNAGTLTSPSERRDSS